LPAPRSLLRWLVANLRDTDLVRSNDYSSWAVKRRLLFSGDRAAVAEAREGLERCSGRREWYIFEGPSYPDAYLDAPAALAVFEGKRTEPNPTTSTTWMRVRHQLIRHMDAAWELRAGRPVFGMMIVEGKGDSEEVPEPWATYDDVLAAPESIAQSLPHRTEGERSAIMRGYLGVITWQQVCRQFQLPWPPAGADAA
jgi:hypothetical protein